MPFAPNLTTEQGHQKEREGAGIVTRATEAIVTGTAEVIVTALGSGPSTARDLSQRLSGIGYANIRQTLRRLALSGIVTNPRRGIYALADEYDAAQERGEIRQNGERSFSSPEKLSATEVLPPKDLHEARKLRDAEAAEPGVIRRALDGAPDGSAATYTTAQIDRAIAGAWAHFDAINDTRNQEAWA